jgi:uncharacterized membrane protein
MKDVAIFSYTAAYRLGMQQVNGVRRLALKADKHHVVMLRSFSGIGLMIGTLFFAASLTPSLVPRSPVIQGVLGGFCLAAHRLAKTVQHRTHVFDGKGKAPPQIKWCGGVVETERPNRHKPDYKI